MNQNVDASASALPDPGDEMDQKVPKSASSSSGVNETSDSSNNSADEYQKQMEEVAEKEKAGQIPTFRDIMDLLKFAYILQVSSIDSVYNNFSADKL